jgi:hypothetical protein
MMECAEIKECHGLWKQNKVNKTQTGPIYIRWCDEPGENIAQLSPLSAAKIPKGHVPSATAVYGFVPNGELVVKEHYEKSDNFDVCSTQDT